MGSASEGDSESATSTSTSTSTGTGSSGGSTETGTSTGDPTTTGDDTGEAEFVFCGQEPPPGAEEAPPVPTFGGICPTIELGFLEGEEVAPNEIATAGGPRRFAVVAPEDIGEDEQLPVIFMWHWLGGTAFDFYQRSEVESAVSELRFIAVIPESKDDVLFKWPFTSLDSD
ncbi:MAG TPA: hypothetical protein ENJ18_04760, partial [Nannocystis exedens]|nr:hypothetical protein [Nannocystis exedens]